MSFHEGNNLVRGTAPDETAVGFQMREINVDAEIALFCRAIFARISRPVKPLLLKDV